MLITSREHVGFLFSLFVCFFSQKSEFHTVLVLRSYVVRAKFCDLRQGDGGGGTKILLPLFF